MAEEIGMPKPTLKELLRSYNRSIKNSAISASLSHLANTAIRFYPSPLNDATITALNCSRNKKKKFKSLKQQFCLKHDDKSKINLAYEIFNEFDSMYYDCIDMLRYLELVDSCIENHINFHYRAMSIFGNFVDLESKFLKNLLEEDYHFLNENEVKIRRIKLNEHRNSSSYKIMELLDDDICVDEMVHLLTEKDTSKTAPPRRGRMVMSYHAATHRLRGIELTQTWGEQLDELINISHREDKAFARVEAIGRVVRAFEDKAKRNDTRTDITDQNPRLGKSFLVANGIESCIYRLRLNEIVDGIDWLLAYDPTIIKHPFSHKKNAGRIITLDARWLFGLGVTLAKSDSPRIRDLVNAILKSQTSHDCGRAQICHETILGVSDILSETSKPQVAFKRAMPVLHKFVEWKTAVGHDRRV